MLKVAGWLQSCSAASVLCRLLVLGVGIERGCRTMFDDGGISLLQTSRRFVPTSVFLLLSVLLSLAIETTIGPRF